MATKRKRSVKKTREINKIILHCSATREGTDIGVNTIRQWHMSAPRNWSDVGYHYVIKLDGTVQVGRPEERIGAHVKGENTNSIGICYIGGVETDGRTPKDTMTIAQELAMFDLIHALRMRYGMIPVHGHNEYAAKACPSFVVLEKYPTINDDVPKSDKP